MCHTTSSSTDFVELPLDSMIGIKKEAPAVCVRKESQLGYYKFVLLPWHGGSRGASCQNWGSALSEANKTVRSIRTEDG